MSVRAVLTEGRRLFMAGLLTAFPWILAAELLQYLPMANRSGDILDTDLMQFSQPGYLARALVCGAAQALLYSAAVLRLARLAGESGGGGFATILRSFPGVLIGYLLYSLLVLVGLGIALLFFVIMLLLFGVWPALLIVLIPLVPTAIMSTALAFFIYPAVLDGCGPFVALGRSAHLARSSWAQATAVVSVPAVVLLLAWFVGNGVTLMHSFTAFESTLANISPDTSLDQLQGLLTRADGSADSGTGGWQIVGTLLGAFAWWYTLAVCYAEYRELQRRFAARAH